MYQALEYLWGFLGDSLGIPWGYIAKYDHQGFTLISLKMPEPIPFGGN